MIRVLVATASRHGATEELGRRIAAAIADCGLAVDAGPIEQVQDPGRYDAFVIGSAVYMRRWLPAARAFTDRHHELLALRPTWLFSSGPVLPGTEEETAPEVTDLVAAVSARDHHVFGGRLAHSELGFGERGIVRLLRLPDVDLREWHAAVAWGTAIGRTLAEEDDAMGAVGTTMQVDGRSIRVSGREAERPARHRASHGDFIG